MTQDGSGGGPSVLPILVNSRAGRRGSDAEQRICKLLEDVGVLVEVRRVEPALLAAEIRRLVDSGEPRLGIGGGDGSMASAAAAVVGTPTALLPIPSGTLNNFARRLGIVRPEDAVDALSRGRLRNVPVGIMDDRIFLNTATFGLYSDVVRRRERMRPFLSKWPSAMLAFLGVLLRMRRIEIVVHLDGEYLRRSTPLLWVGLGAGGVMKGENAEEGRESDLEVVLLRPGTRVNALSLLLRLGIRLVRGERPFADPSLETLHARHMLIHGTHLVGVTLDGEVYRCDPPIFIGVVDDALHVLVPVEADDSTEVPPSVN